MLTQTNNQETFQFVGFLTEALTTINYRVPTEINSGGCGVFATLLRKALIDLGYSPRIFALYYDDEQLDKRLEYFNTGNHPENSGEDHIVIELDGMYLDSTGIVNVSVFMAKKALEITHEQLETVVATGRWNPVFDRQQTDVIQKFLTDFFSQWKDGIYKPGTLAVTIPEEGLKLSEATIRAKKEQMGFSEAGFASLFRGL